MKLIECQIQNFGTLSSKKYTFGKGINCFLDDNGSGKTTLAYFIKSMFYGLGSAGKKKSAADSDRVRFCPWNNGIFGGSLTFSEGEKTYRIERGFRDRPGNDTFKLVDLATGKESHDYSENIGQELFGINSHAYIISSYFSKDIPGKDREAGGAQSITARLGGIVDEADIENYGKADNALNERKNELKKQETSLKNKIEELKRRRGAREEKEKELSLETAAQQKLYDTARKAEEEEGRLEERFEASLSLETKQEKHKAYLKCLNNRNAKEKRLQELSEFFRCGMPDSARIDKLEEAYRELPALIKEVEAASSDICTRAARFEIDFPTLPDIEKLRELQNDYQGASFEQKMLEASESENDAEIESFTELSEQECENIRRAIYARDTSKSRADTAREALMHEKSGKHIPLPLAAGCIVSLVIAIIGSILHIQKSACGFWVFLSGAALFTALACICVFNAFNLSKKRAALNNECDKAEWELSIRQNELSEYEKKLGVRVDNADELNKLMDSIREEKERQRRINEQKIKAKEAKIQLENCSLAIRSYFRSIGRGDLSAAQLDATIAELENYLRFRDEAKRLTNKAELAKEKEKQNNEHISKFFAEFELDSTSDAREKFRTIRSAVTEYQNTEKELEAAKDELEELIKENPESVEDPEKDGESLTDAETISQMRTENKAGRLRLAAQIEEKRQIVSELSEYCEREAGLEEEIERAAAEYEKIKYRISVIEKTKELLLKAKEELSGRYLNPIRASLRKYLAFFDGDALVETSIDTDLNAVPSVWGFGREKDFFSSGTRDLIDLAMHFALFEAVFDGRESFIILDDPFVNLDKGRTKKASEFLLKLAQNTQIIYFTCHESRLPCLEGVISL